MVSNTNILITCVSPKSLKRAVLHRLASDALAACLLTCVGLNCTGSRWCLRVDYELPAVLPMAVGRRVGHRVSCTFESQSSLPTLVLGLLQVDLDSL